MTATHTKVEYTSGANEPRRPASTRQNGRLGGGGHDMDVARRGRLRLHTWCANVSNSRAATHASPALEMNPNYPVGSGPDTIKIIVSAGPVRRFLRS
jgi:hypothetical protein